MGLLLSRYLDSYFSRVSLESLPIEIIERILFFVGDDAQSIIACTRVCSIFRDLIREIRLPRFHCLSSKELVRIPTIRRIRGTLVLGEIDELEAISERVEGDLKILFPCTKDPVTGEMKWTFYHTIHASPDPESYLVEGVTKALDVVRRRASRYPENVVRISLDRVGIIRWRQGRCRLILPTPGVSEGFPRKFLKSLSKFMCEVPITHLEFLQVFPCSYDEATDSWVFETVGGRDLYKPLVESPVVTTLTTFTIFSRAEDLFFRSIYEEAIFPALRTLVFDSSVNPQGQDLFETWVRLIGCNFTHQITTIKGSGYLVFSEDSCKTWEHGLIIKGFPNVYSWEILIIRPCMESEKRKGPLTNIQEFLDSLETLEILVSFRSFWLQYRDNKQFRVWYQ